MKQKKALHLKQTAAGTNYVKYLKEAKKRGYHINLTFLWLSSADLAVERVAKRVAQGGHHIPEATIRRRYLLGQKNLLKYYLPLVDHALILDNSYIESRKVIAEGSKIQLRIEIPHIWKKIESVTNGEKKAK